MSQSALGSSLVPTDRVAITGAAGWLGRELINQLHATAPEVQILALGSRPSELLLPDGTTHQVHDWLQTRVEDWQPTYFVHLAFITRERQAEFSAEQYLIMNQHITSEALKALQWKSIRGLLVASSGAAIQDVEDQYGRLKAQDEANFASEGERRGIPTVIARAWSLTGAYCTKPQHFLFFDLILQSLSADVNEIEIRAAHRVLRKYVDAGQYLEICLGALARSWSGVIDSTGPLVEASELADAIQLEVGTKKPIVRPELSGLADEYFSDSQSLDHWADVLGLALLDLPGQIRRSMGVRSQA